MSSTTLFRAGLTTAIVDFLFATALSVFAYGSTFTRLWQGVASVLIGARAFEGGAATTGLGIAMHVFVAFSWTAIFLLLITRIPAFKRLLLSPGGSLKAAVLYGPCVWLVMSFIVIPTMTGGGWPTLTFRWWVQLLGHIPAVALPMALVARTAARKARGERI